MNEELMITKEDLVNWLNRPPSNDDLDLIGFITTRLENFYKLEQENKQLKEQLEDTTTELFRANKKISEAIEYIKENFDKTGICVSGSDLPYSYIEELLKILGDKENE